MIKFLKKPMTINTVRLAISWINVKKKKEYTASKIVITKAMGTSDVMDWNMKSITKRDIRVADEVVKIMNRWNNEYLNTPVCEGKAGEPSEEELAQIEKFKKNGWI